MAIFACKQAYLPPVVKNPPTYLVVEGFINNGPDSTWFNLTNTYQLNGDSNAAPVLGATVTVQGNDNTSYTLGQTGNTGLYTAHMPPLNPNTLYRLHITTTGGTQYASDYVPLMTDPPIDSTNIILGTSTALKSDVIFETPLVFIPLNAQQLNILYSIYVRQYAITEAAFSWWSVLQNNTEDIGSIFGVQPTIDQGNLHCLSDSSQQAIGYVSAGTLQTQRIFISNQQVYPWNYQPPCGITHLPPDSIDLYYTFGYLIVGYGPGSLLNVSYKTCVDCTLTGTNKKPYFWP